MKIYKYIGYKKAFYIGGILKLVEVGLEIFLPVFMGILIDYAVNNYNPQVPFYMLAAILLFTIVGFLSTYVSHVLVAKVSLDFARNVKNDMFEKVLDFAYGTRTKFSSTTIVNRMNNDVLTLQNALGMTMRIATRAPFLLVGSLIMIMIINFQIGLILLLGYLSLMLMIVVISLVLVKMYRYVQRNRERNDRIVRENIRGMRVVRSYGKQAYERQRFDEQTNNLVKSQKQTAVIVALSTPLSTLLLNIVLVVMLYFSADLINIGTLSTGQVLTMINYTAQLLVATIALLNIILLYARSVIAYERVKEVLAQETVIDGNQSITGYDIEFNNVELGFNNHCVNVLNNLNFKIEYGQKIGIIGLTGAGKTTLLRAINKYITPNSGLITIGQTNISDISMLSHSEKIGYVPQNRTLFSGDVKFNLTLGKHYEINELKEVLSLVNLDSSDHFLATKINEGGTNFSGGQRQRLNIARALIQKPAILLLDDVFSSIDAKNQSQIKENLFNLDYQPTIILTTTRISHIQDFDRIIVMANNEIIACDSHFQLLKTCLYYKELFEQQK